MKKVSTGEKVFVIGICSLIAGLSSAMTETSILGAVLVGLGCGVVGAVIIGLLYRIRS